MRYVLVFLSVFFLASGLLFAEADNNNELQQQEENSSDRSIAEMDNNRLQMLIEAVDKDFQGQPGYWQLHAEGALAIVITDERANRMRVVVQVVPASNLDPEELYRMMQANFDTALDARYAIANGMVFSTFIHPLKELGDEQFISGLAQSITLAQSFGDTYSSGGMQFLGGDTAAAERELYERLLQQFRDLGESI